MLLVSFSLLPFSAWAQNALILIRHDRAGPNLPSADYVHAEWIRWPAEGPSGASRMLALACGVDLEGQAADLSFGEVDGGRMAANGAKLQNRGFYDARAALLGGASVAAVENSAGGIGRAALLLALDGPARTVFPRPFGSPLPPSGLVAHEALSWDEARSLSDRVRGRTLIVELPQPGVGWSRFWMRGGWPAGVPAERAVRVPGLVRAHRALDLLLRPGTFDWSPNDAGRWGGPNRWLEHGHETSRGVLLGWFLVATFVLAWALAQVMNEDRGPFVSEMLVFVALSPAALVLAGAAERAGGLEAWPVWIPVAWLGLYAAALALRFALRGRAEGHPLWPACLVGLATMTLLDPLWSDLSGRFAGLEVAVPGGALGAFAGYLAGAAALGPGRGFGRALAAATVLWGATAHPWWVDGHAALLALPVAALLAAEGLFRPALLLPLALMPTAVVRLAREGVAWSPEGLVGVVGDARSINLWRTAAFVLSPQWLGTLGFLLSVALVGNRFLGYRLRRLLKGDPRLRALLWTAAATLSLGVAEPLALPAAPVVGLGALLAIAYEGLRANA